MPELPEVETIARQLKKITIDSRVEKVQVKLNKIVRTGPRKLATLLKGACFKDVRRMGKQLVFEFDRDRFLVVHLKMTGQFLWSNGDAELPKHVHVVFLLNDGNRLLYRDMRQFGYFLGFSGPEFALWQNNLDIGPDPFQIKEKEFVNHLSTRKTRIKPLLLDQSFISGLGNIYVDEALYASGIHPLSQAGNIPASQARDLFKAIRRILREAIKLKGSTIQNYMDLESESGQYQNKHLVYHQQGKPCPTCGREIEKMVVGGRGTHTCPHCQKLFK